MVGSEGRLPLPWLAKPLETALSHARGHALLVHGQQGVGQFELAVAIAQSWLCEAPQGLMACGACASCKLVQARTHPDVLVLLPEATREALGWTFGDDSEGAAATDRSSKRKPSKDIRVEEVRAAISFAQTTSSRGRAKVVVLHPAERMNAVSANALLKTLEEPPGQARLLLSCAAPDRLLPTIRSRCQAFALDVPAHDLAVAWLAEQGVNDAQVLLAGMGGAPQDVLACLAEGIDAAQWKALPRQVARGEVGTFANWPIPRMLDALQKLCHDALRIAAGAGPRYFARELLPNGPADVSALAAWSRELFTLARHAEHPFNAGLMAESLVQTGARVLSAARRAA